MRRAQVVSLLFALFAAAAAFGRQLPNINRLGDHAPSAANAAALAQKAQTLGKKVAGFSGEPRFGVPTFIWGSPNLSVLPAPFKAVGASTPSEAESAARAHLGNVASLYNLSDSDVAEATLRYIHDTGKGPVIVKLQQKVDGIEIFNEEINVVMNQKLDLVAITGYISSKLTPASAQAGSLTFRLNPQQAAGTALVDVTTASISASQLVAAGSHDGYDYFTLRAGSGVVLDEPVRMKKVYFHLPEGLEPGYYVEVQAEDPSLNVNQQRIADGRDGSNAYAYVISAADGGILFRENLTADAAPKSGGANLLPAGGFTYRVWADPVTGIPYDTPAGNAVHPKVVATPDGYQAPFVPPQDVSLANFPFSMNDPWIASGATETNGNNADAFLNLFSPDGLGNPITTTPTDPPNGDYRAQITAAGQFLHTHVPDADHSTAEARQGSIQQLFYNINFLHDWYYDAGFNEASGNAQTNNYGRGGVANDNIKAQVQDFSGFSNANMLTPADGGRPRMRMYNFPSPANNLEIQAPLAIAGKYVMGISMSGPQTFDVTNDFVIATFTSGPTTCTVTNAGSLTGKTAMFDFDNTDGTGCSFSTRIARITATNPAAIVMVYTASSPTAVPNITGFVLANTKPVVTISWNTGLLIKGQIGSTTVTGRAFRAPDRDGTIDNQIVFHEWGHYLSNRLVGNSSGLNTNLAGGMGEGWGDFSAMMLTVRESDTATPSNANWNGAYALATYATSGVPFNGSANQGYYFGIRRYPYSTDMNINPLTFQHIQNGTPLPVGPPLAFGASGLSNAEVHNTGEVWTTMLWECYASLLRDTLGATPRLTFQQAQDRMKQYLVASLKMTPTQPTMLETRDAVLAAAYATDYVDFIEFQQAFAKRGAGLNAVSPDRFSSTNVGVTESYITGGELQFVGATLDDTNGSCDHDGVLDANEAGKLTITLKNTGDQHLSATTATITTTNPAVTIANGGNVSFPASDPFGTTVASIGVSLTGSVAIESIDFTVSFNDPGLAVAGPRTADAFLRANYNVTAAASATDDVESPNTHWTTAGNATLSMAAPFVREQQTASFNHVWFGPDPGFGSDQYVVSPVLTVDGGGSLNVQFDHSFGFEFDGGGNYDGGVVEMSVNGGAFADISTAAYNGTIATGGVNPLRGRTAFVQNSGGTIHTSLTAAIAPGSTVQVRFRVGSDSSIGAAGWTIDNVAFTGVVETPFDVLVADPGCSVATATTLTTSANPTPFSSSLTLTATVVSLRGAPGGTVTFMDGASPLGTAPLSGGVATFPTSVLTVGTHTLTALYTGGPGFAPSSSTAVSQAIGKADTTTVAGATNTYVSPTRAVTFTADVTSTGGTVAGSVTFAEGLSTLATRTLSAGSASFTVPSLTVGVHTITVSYLGNGSFNPSSGTVQVTVAAQTVKSDLSADGMSDITLQSSVDYRVSVWRMSDTTILEGKVVATPAGPTTLRATGDLDGDGSADLILQNAAGGVAWWRMSGTTLLEGWIIDTLPAGWRVVGTWDYNHDGKSDIILQNDITGDIREWQMNGRFITSNQLIGNNSAKAIATGSFGGGDGLLFENQSTGEVSRCIINGSTMAGMHVIGTLPSGSHVKASGDFDRNGVDDLVIQDPATGQVSIWRLTPQANILANVVLANPPVVSEVRGTGDYDGDGRPDILLQNTSTHHVAMWKTDGTTLLFGWIVATPNPDMVLVTK